MIFNTEENMRMLVAARVVPMRMNDNDFQVLLLKRTMNSKVSHGHNRGKLEVSGGRVEPGNTFRETQILEFFQETGINIIPKNFDNNHTFCVDEVIDDEKNKYNGYTYITIVSLAKIAKTEKVKLSEEHDDYEWVSFKDIDKLKKDLTEVTFKSLKFFGIIK